jgi:hypothetical protein
VVSAGLNFEECNFGAISAPKVHCSNDVKPK